MQQTGQLSTRDRVDEGREEDRVDHVDAELDPLERRAPDDRQRDGAERELEQELGLDRRVRQAHDPEGLLWVTVVARKNPCVTDELAVAEREREADGPVQDRGDREVGEDLRDDGAGVLRAREADLQEREAGLHEDHEAAGDEHPDGVDRRRCPQYAAIAASSVSAYAAAGSSSERRGRAPRRTRINLIVIRPPGSEITSSSLRPAARGSLARCRRFASGFRRPVGVPRAGRNARCGCLATWTTPSPRAARIGWPRSTLEEDPCHIPVVSTTSMPPSGAPTGARSGSRTSPSPAPTSSARTSSPAPSSASGSPRPSSRQLQATLAAGEPLDPALADAVAAAMKEWALEQGATHFTHWFQPLTGSTAEKHDSFFAPDRRRHGDRRVLRQGAHPGRAGRVVVPDRRHPGDVRGPRLHGLGPDVAGVHPREPQRRAAVHPDGVRVVDGRGAGQQDPAAALDGRAVAARPCARCGCSATTSAARVFTTVGPEQEYFLIDEQYYFERPDLVTTGRTLFGAKPPKGQELDDHYFGSIPERVLACMLDAERELAKLGVPVKTRHNEVAPAQYEIAPIFENSNIASDHQQLIMEILQNVARRLRPGLPAAREALRGRQRLRQAQQLVDGHRHGRQPARAGRDAAREPAVPVLLRRGHPGRRQAPGAAARVGRQRRPRPSPGRQRGAAGDHLGVPRRPARRHLRRDRGGAGDGAHAGGYLELGASVLPPLPEHDGDRNRTSPFAFTGNKFEFRALGSSMSLALPEHCAQHDRRQAIDDLADKLEQATSGGEVGRGGDPRVVKQAWSDHKRDYGGVPAISEFAPGRLAAVRRPPALRHVLLPRLPLPLERAPAEPARGARQPQRHRRRDDRPRELERRHRRGLLARARRRSAAVAEGAGRRSRSSGFESSTTLPVKYAYVAVQALDSAGHVLGTSQTVSVIGYAASLPSAGGGRGRCGRRRED